MNFHRGPRSTVIHMAFSWVKQGYHIPIFYGSHLGKQLQQCYFQRNKFPFVKVFEYHPIERTTPLKTNNVSLKGTIFNRKYIWTNHWFSGDIRSFFGGVYPPVNKHSNGKSSSWIGNTSSNGGFSIAMLDYRSVVLNAWLFPIRFLPAACIDRPKWPSCHFTFTYPWNYTPRKINMEPPNHPFGKEHDLPNHHFQAPAVNLPECKGSHFP